VVQFWYNLEVQISFLVVLWFFI